MKVRALKDYYDLELNKTVKALDEFEVADARAKELASAKNKAKQPLVEIVEEATPTTKKVAKAAPKKKAD